MAYLLMLFSTVAVSSPPTTANYFYTTSINAPICPLVGIIHPAAQFYNGKTYVTSLGKDWNPYIMYYDSTTKTWSDTVKIGDNPLAGDRHSASSMLIDNSGYIHMFYGAHTGALKYKKSTNPEDITSWTTMTDINAVTYPQPIQLSDGTIYLFYRNGGHTDDWVYRTSTDGGNSWNSPISFIDGVAPADAWYCMVTKGINDTIHVGFDWKDDTASTEPIVEAHYRYNIYYMFRDTDGHWKNISGTIMTLPLSKSDADTYCKVYDSGSDIAQTPYVDVDENGNPYMLFITGGLYGSTNYAYKLAKWNGSAWKIFDVGDTTDCFFDSYALDVRSSTDIDAYITTGGSQGVGDITDRGGNIEKWSSTDGGSTWVKVSTIISTVTSNGDFNNNPQIVFNYEPNAKVVHAKDPHLPIRIDERLYLYGDSGFITNNIRAPGNFAMEVSQPRDTVGGLVAGRQ